MTWTLIAAAVVLYLAGCLVHWAATYFVLLYERANHPDGYSPASGSARGSIGGALGELAITTLSFLILPGYFPVRLVFGARQRPARPVLLVHGYSRNPLDFAALIWRLRRGGYGPVIALRLSPVTGGLERFAWRVSRELRRADQPEFPPWTVIGHSMGGIVTRMAMREFGIWKRMGLLVTIGSPHHGSKLAAFGIGQGIAQLRHSGGLLAQLNRNPWELSLVPVLSIRSNNDELVLPSASSDLPPPARNTALDGPGHLGLLWSAQTWHAIQDAAAALPSPRSGPAAATEPAPGGQPAAVR